MSSVVRERIYTHRLLITLAVIAVLTIVAFPTLIQPLSRKSDSIEQSVTLDETMGNFSSRDALRRSMENLPKGAQPESWFVNEAEVEELLIEWYQSETILDWPPRADVWIVAMSLNGFTRDDVLDPPPFDKFVRADQNGYQSPPVRGVYFVWSKDTGMLAAQGAIGEGQIAADWNTLDRLMNVGNTVLTPHVDNQPEQH